MRREPQTYTVIGVYADNGYQRFADTTEAYNAEQAEDDVVARAEGDLIVAAVVAGAVHCADVDGR